MNVNDPNVQLVEGVVAHLEEMKDLFVFVGGCVTGLLVTDPARPPVRATGDVDLVAEVTTTADYYQLGAQLRAKGFKEDSESAVICRWRIGIFQVDIMPSEPGVLNFSNRWYRNVIREAELCSLPSGVQIRLIPPALFLASKLEAFYDRGNGDFGVSHDMEDIITVIDGRPEIVNEVVGASRELQDYLREEFDYLLSEPTFADRIGWHLAGDSASQARIPQIIARLRGMAGI